MFFGSRHDAIRTPRRALFGQTAYRCTPTPIRLLFSLYERDNWGASVAGRKLLRGCVETLADNKACEELHHYIRLDAKGQANQKQHPSHVQSMLMQGDVLEARDINHSARVTKDTFLANDQRRNQLPFQKHKHKSRPRSLERSSGILLRRQMDVLRQQRGAGCNLLLFITPDRGTLELTSPQVS